MAGTRKMSGNDTEDRRLGKIREGVISYLPTPRKLGGGGVCVVEGENVKKDNISR